MPRTILIHLNVEADGSDQRTADEIATGLLASLGLDRDARMVDDFSGNPRLIICAPLIEEID